jgi:hypothetical protein
MKPAHDHHDLPATAQTTADLSGGAPLLLGRLVWRCGERRRPFLFLDVACPCGSFHRCAWRHDWGLGPDVVSYQLLRCGRGRRAAWLAIDPAHAGEASRVHAEAHEAFVKWREELPAHREADKAARKARQAAARAAKALEPVTEPPKAAEAKPPAVKPKRPASVGLGARLATRRASALTMPPVGPPGGNPRTPHPAEANAR